MLIKTVSTILAATLAAAWESPAYTGLTTVWQDTFGGPGNTLPSSDWNVLDRAHNSNNEQEAYTSSTDNVQLSGGSTVQIIPRRAGATGWTSGRLESRYVFTPAEGRVSAVEARIRFGTDAGKKGIWPAFWMLGESCRSGGVSWPQCGEIDGLEMVNGGLTGYGTVHCDTAPGGICNEYNGIGGRIDMPDLSWHTWRVTWDRRPDDWRSETITWTMDGQQFHQVAGLRINNYAVWQSLAQTPLFFILNVAVGGDWPGPPDNSTTGGFGNMMEIAYVAHYEAN